MTLDQTGLQIGNFMTYLSRRQEVIASNIANADTPGYQTRDLSPPADFSSALSDAGGALGQSPGLASRNDGNNVSMDREARLLAENSLKFNLATQMLRSQIKGIRSAIEDGRGA
jgi:flagellar basal-body rod protein FlgB